MKLSCPSCGAKYSIADEKVQDRLAKIRCRKCSATIIVDGKVSPPNVYTSDAGSAGAAEASEQGGAVAAGEYSVDFGDNDQRNMTKDDIVAAFRRGEVTQDTYVWADGMSDWSPISAVPELSQALSSAAAAPVPAPVAEAPRQQAARSGAGRGSAHDLFGGIERAGGEDDVMTSAAAPAPAPVAAAAPPVAATGARNESSVLFSLSALTAATGAAPAAAPVAAPVAASVSKSTDHDSGLIDLRALASASTAQAPASPLMIGTAPLGMAAPLGGITAPAIPSEAPPQKAASKTGLYIGGAIVIVGALIAGAIFMSGSHEAPAAAVPAPTPSAAPVAAAAPEPKKEEPTALPPATGTASAEPAPAGKAAAAATPAAKPGTAAPVGGGHKKASGGTAAAAAPAAAAPAAAAPAPAAAAPPPPPKPKAPSCNCPPGDLMCAMKCASAH